MLTLSSWKGLEQYGKLGHKLFGHSHLANQVKQNNTKMLFIITAESFLVHWTNFNILSVKMLYFNSEINLIGFSFVIYLLNCFTSICFSLTAHVS